VLGFANQSAGATSGGGSHLVIPDASGVKIYGLTEKQAGLPGAEILPQPPALDWRSPVRL
jgi:hypothetical protein